MDIGDFDGLNDDEIRDKIKEFLKEHDMDDIIAELMENVIGVTVRKIDVKDGDLNDEDEVVNFHKGYVKRAIMEDGGINPMVVFKRNNKVVVTVLPSSDEMRPVWKIAIRSALDIEPEWCVFMSEAYMKQQTIDKKEKNYKERMKSLENIYRHGDLQREFKLGQVDVKEIINFVFWFGKKRFGNMIEIIRDDSGKIIDFKDFNPNKKKGKFDINVGGYLVED